MRRNLLLLILFLIFSFAINCFKEENKDFISVSLESFPASFDPRYSTDQSSERVLTLTHRGLFNLNEKMEPIGDIALSYKFLTPVKIEIQLKKDIYFSNGNKVLSDDVIYTINSILQDKPISPKRTELDVIKEIRRLDDHSLEIELKTPFAPLLSLLNFGIVPKDSIFDPEKIPIGCGYYKVLSIKRGKEIWLIENPFSKDKPKIKKILMKAIENPSIRSLELLRGSVDIVVNDIPYDSLKSFNERGFNVVTQNGTNYSYIGLNCSKHPLNKKEVRIALSMAIQRKEILENVIRGFGREATGLLSPENWAYFKTQNLPFNPKLAEEILDRVGLLKDEKGVRFKLSYKTSMNKVSRLIAESVSENLKEIGVELEIQTLEWGTFYEDIKKGNFDMFALNWIGIKDPDAYRYRFHSLMVPPKGFNRGWYKNCDLDSLLEEGAKETDFEKRKAIYRKVQEILSDEMPYVNLWWPDVVVVANKRIKPFKIPSDGNFIFLKDIETGN